MYVPFRRDMTFLKLTESDVFVKYSRDNKISLVKLNNRLYLHSKDREILKEVGLEYGKIFREIYSPIYFPKYHFFKFMNLSSYVLLGGIGYLMLSGDIKNFLPIIETSLVLPIFGFSFGFLINLFERDFWRKDYF